MKNWVLHRALLGPLHQVLVILIIELARYVLCVLCSVLCFRYILCVLCSVFGFWYVLCVLWAILKHLTNLGLVGFWAWELSMPDTFSSSLWSSTKGGQLWSPTLNNFDSKLLSWVNSISDWKIVGVSVTFSLLHYIPSLPVLITVITDITFFGSPIESTFLDKVRLNLFFYRCTLYQPRLLRSYKEKFRFCWKAPLPYFLVALISWLGSAIRCPLCWHYRHGAFCWISQRGFSHLPF